MDLTWKRSSFCNSGSNCVEIAWQRSSFCANGSCVEVGHSDGWTLVRDSKNPDREPLAFRPDTWMNTVLAPIMLRRIPVDIDITDGYEWRGHTADGQEQQLHFTGEEWDAFTAGVRTGEFTPWMSR